MSQAWSAKSVGARLVEIRGSATQDEFARRLGIGRSRYAAFEAGINKDPPPIQVLEAVAKAASVSVPWLLTGEEPPEPLARPSLPILGAADCGGWNEPEVLRGDEAEPLEVGGELYGKGGQSRMVIRARGDSMKPVVLPGDYMIFDTSRTPRNRDIVAARIASLSSVKRYFRDVEGGPVRLQPENNEFPAIICKDKALRVQGVLIGVVRLIREKP